VVMADEQGRIIDGDQILALIARSWAKNGLLKGGGVVGTVMSNAGLDRYLQTQGLKLARAQVGDRYVIEEMKKGGFNVGGEQSGHIVLSDFATTGDGLIAALQVLAVLAMEGQKASEAAHLFEPLPQVLENVRFKKGMPLEDARVKKCIADGNARLNGAGRILVRKSGTEPVIRLEVEDDAVNPVLAERPDAVAAKDSERRLQRAHVVERAHREDDDRRPKDERHDRGMDAREAVERPRLEERRRGAERLGPGRGLRGSLVVGHGRDEISAPG